jgi:Tfp pilus assembly protein PilO
MPRSFNLRLPVKGLKMKDPRVAMRAVIGVLLVANLAAAVFAFKPFGGSAEDLRREQEALRSQLAQAQARLATNKRLVEKVQTAREQGDQFLGKYVTDRRTTFSIIVDELNRMAKDAGIKPRDATLTLDPVEGSDTLSMMTISAGYEGNYASLTKFVNLLDKSQRFLIIESMVAAPQQGGQSLVVSLRLDTFVKDVPGGVS